MTVSMNLICGISLGIEFVDPIPEMDVPRSIIVDVFILRFLIEW